MSSSQSYPTQAVLVSEPDGDRRDTLRRACEEVRPIKLLARPSFQSHPAYIRDFSRYGVGLVLARPFAPGTLLALQLRRRLTGVSDILTAQVCHATNLAKNYWALGCRLSRSLSEAERLALEHDDFEAAILGAASHDQ